jgi:hypothetical protein
LNKRRTALVTIPAILLAIGLMVGLIWANLFYIGLNPSQSNFLPRWLGVRLFMTKSMSPYSAETTAEIEKAQQAGGFAPAPGSSYFLYPFNAFVVYSPFALTGNQTAARAAWMTFLEIALFAALALSLSLSHWRAPAWALALLGVFTITWYYGLHPVANGDLSVLVTFFVAGALVSIRAEQDALAGFLLALAMVKPVPVLLLVIFVAVWAVSCRRMLLMWSFLGSLALMTAATSLLIPDWVVQNIRQVIQYLKLPHTSTPGALVSFWLPGIGKQVGWLLTILTVILLVWEWYHALGKEFRWFYWTACLTLAVSPLVGLPTSLDNFIIMFPGLILILAAWDERWGRVGKLLWLASLLILSIGGWWLALGAAQAGMPPYQNPWLFFFLPFFMLGGAYWVRWSVIHPPRLPVEMAALL